MSHINSHKLGCVVRMVVDSILHHAESGPNDHRKNAPPFILLSSLNSHVTVDVLGLNSDGRLARIQIKQITKNGSNRIT